VFPFYTLALVSIPKFLLEAGSIHLSCSGHTEAVRTAVGLLTYVARCQGASLGLCDNDPMLETYGPDLP